MLTFGILTTHMHVVCLPAEIVKSITDEKKVTNLSITMSPAQRK